MTLAAAYSSLWASLKATGGVSITYSRGESDYVGTGVPVTNRRQSLLADASVTDHEAVEWLFYASESPMSDVTTPAKGDVIDWGGTKYQILSDGGQPLWSYHGANKYIIRLTTKRINAAAV